MAGDVFDSHLPPPRLISTALERIGQLPFPVSIIPGNHDYGGPGNLWLSDHMQREQQALAPNLTVLLRAEPLERDDAILLPCPRPPRRAGHYYPSLAGVFREPLKKTRSAPAERRQSPAAPLGRGCLSASFAECLPQTARTS